jgi:hypothetical protein
MKRIEDFMVAPKAGYPQLRFVMADPERDTLALA